MTNQDRESSAKLLTLARKSFPSSKADAETITLYLAALDDLTYAQIKAGVLKCMNTAKFFPTIAEIREAAESMVEHANHTGKPDAGEAWGEVMRFVTESSPYDQRPFRWSCEEVHEAVKRLGTMTLFEMTNDGIPATRGQFMKIYDKLLAGQKDKAVMDMVGKKLGADYTALIDHTTMMLGMGGGRELPKGGK